MQQQIIIIGGGAAGFFAAITCAENNPEATVTILEKGNEVLQKVKISGGGRCNVTHACFDPKELCTFYPRGSKELLGPFYQFMTGDTMQWFEGRGVELKIEADNRVFPKTNSSQSIVDILKNEAQKHKVNVRCNHRVEDILKGNKTWKISTNKGVFTADKLLIASGSNTQLWNILSKLGHTIVKPVPSLFTFKIGDKRIKNIPGISVPKATLRLEGSSFVSCGALLITHWGLSGPAVLKLSAFGALFLAEKNYQFNVVVNWLSKPFSQIFNELKQYKTHHGKKQLAVKAPFTEISKRLWEKLVLASNLKLEQRWAETSTKQLQNIAHLLTNTIFKANGKATFKEEFVTAGGVDLKEINFKRFESKRHKNLFFAGEVLNIDAVTGGFNFQNAWTGGYIAGKAMGESIL